MAFSFELFIEAMLTPAMIRGAGIALVLTVLVFVISFFACLPMALWLGSKKKLRNIAAKLYVWVFRAAPVILILLFVWNGTPQLFPALLKSSWFTPFVAATVSLVLITIAYMAEIMRSALSSVAPGQGEAAQALGLGRFQTFRLVVMPQALRIALPPMVNEFINVLKVTSLAYVISLREIMAVVNDSIAATFRFVEWYTAALVYYLIIVSLFMMLQGIVARRQSKADLA
ncbi:amino acid ABC transporter permease [uncultured Nitratireductor sp.]|uniref:amino acid ABC transporter permease n=1 Tax=uncultured Nitratireductor sp. TaxID=520953 RepID=UPI0025D73757|nr:amino acid ABC transporter permease [uncultured Nitratireductor sp.]